MQRDAARRRRDEEAELEKKNPLQQYVELLGSQDEAAWKEWLIGMGQVRLRDWCCLDRLAGPPAAGCPFVQLLVWCNAPDLLPASAER